MHRHPLGAKRRARVPEFVNKNRRVPEAEAAAAVLKRRLSVGPRMLSGAGNGALYWMTRVLAALPVARAAGRAERGRN